MEINPYESPAGPSEQPSKKPSLDHHFVGYLMNVYIIGHAGLMALWWTDVGLSRSALALPDRIQLLVWDFFNSWLLPSVIVSPLLLLSAVTLRQPRRLMAILDAATTAMHIIGLWVLVS